MWTNSQLHLIYSKSFHIESNICNNFHHTWDLDGECLMINNKIIPLQRMHIGTINWKDINSSSEAVSTSLTAAINLYFWMCTHTCTYKSNKSIKKIFVVFKSLRDQKSIPVYPSWTGILLRLEPFSWLQGVYLLCLQQ